MKLKALLGKASLKAMTSLSAMALLSIPWWIGRMCTTFLYQPVVPECLREME